MPFSNYTVSNNAQGTLLAGIGAAVTSIILSAGQGAMFPATGPFWIKVEQYDTALNNYRVLKREIIKVTSRAADTLNVTGGRGAGTCPPDYATYTQGTTAFSFNAGDTVSHVITAEQVKDIQDETITKASIVQVQNWALNYAAAGGGVNAYTVTLSPAPSAYSAGQTFEFLANAANTGACTVNFNGLGAKSITKLGWGTTLIANDILNNQLVKVQYDGTNFQMQTPTGTMGSAPIVTQPGAYIADSGASNAYVATLSPALASYSEWNHVCFKASAANTATSTINVNGLGAKTILNPDGSILAPQTIRAGQMVDVVYDGTNFILTSLVPRTRIFDKVVTAQSSGTTVETTAYSATLPANSLGIAWSLKISGNYTLTYGAAATGTIRFKIGATTFATIALDAGTSSDSTWSSGRFECVIMNNNSASVQKSFASADGAHIGTVSGITSYGVAKDTKTGTINTTTDQTITVTVQTTNASTPCVIEAMLVELIV